MAQEHLDRLSATDASFLINEGRASHMHVGGITIFEGPPPALADFSDQMRGRLHLVPRYRQKLATPPPHGLGASVLDASSGRKLGVEELFAH